MFEGRASVIKNIILHPKVQNFKELQTCIVSRNLRILANAYLFYLTLVAHFDLLFLLESVFSHQNNFVPKTINQSGANFGQFYNFYRNYPND